MQLKRPAATLPFPTSHLPTLSTSDSRPHLAGVLDELVQLKRPTTALVLRRDVRLGSK